MGRFAKVLLAVFGVVLGASAAGAQATLPVATVKPSIHSADAPDLLHETQQAVGERGYAGLVWWIPFEFWTQTAAAHGLPAQAAENVKALKDYTVVGIFLAQVSDYGEFHYVTPAELRQKVMLRDAAGNEYRPIPPSADAKTVAAILKPVLANAMGPAGENFEVLFFPAQDKNGEPIADATKKGAFAVILRDPPGLPESVYEWRLPLTSVSPPKYCPVGKERVQANWDYCPWHGVPLNPLKSAH